jgi:hypothetical protein
MSDACQTGDHYLCSDFAEDDCCACRCHDGHLDDDEEAEDAVAR